MNTIRALVERGIRSGNSSIFAEILEELYKPNPINVLLRDLDSDEDRIIAMKGICTCGVIKNDGICWSCFESGPF